MIEIGVFALLLAAYSIFSKRLEGSMLTAPMIFVGAGLILSSNPIDLLDLRFFDGNVLLIGEIALVLILFSDALRVRLTELGSSGILSIRLLTIGLLLTLAAGAALAMVTFTALGFWEAAVLAAILAPTDAGLGQAVISDHRVPRKIRNSLNVESGLNDGFVTPFFVIFAGIAEAEEEQAISLITWIDHIASDLAFGVVSGVLTGYIGARLVRWSMNQNWISPAYEKIVLPALAIFAWQFAGYLEGNGFVAAFVAGVITAWILGSEARRSSDFIELSGEVIVFAVFFVFAIAATNTFGDISLRIWIYAILSLTVIRMIPVVISLIGTKLNIATTLFIGWFGPRGLASIVLLLLLVNEYPEVGGIPTIVDVVVVTVILSVFLHGLSANPLIVLLQRRLSQLPPSAPEFASGPEINTRLTSLRAAPVEENEPQG